MGIGIQYVYFEILTHLLLSSLGVIDVLIYNGRHIDAVNLAFAFELTQQFPPVSLLKSYLNEASKASIPLNSGNASPTVQVCSLCLAIIWTALFFHRIQCSLLCHGPCIETAFASYSLGVGMRWTFGLYTAMLLHLMLSLLADCM